MSFITIDGHGLEVDHAPAGDDAATMVFLHEGLGSVALWKDFPERAARAVGCGRLVYSRLGYGRSDPLTAPRPVDFMHHEALVVLPALLDQLNIARPILFGHSDGASIAIIHAGAGIRPVAALILMAPHVIVEDVTVASIEAARVAYETTDLRARLARYHSDVDSAFRGWNDIWLDPAFRSWNIEGFLPHIRCPVLAIQGNDDEYGSADQIARVQCGAPSVQSLMLAACGHSPHRDQPDAVVAAVQSFLHR